MPYRAGVVRVLSQHMGWVWVPVVDTTHCPVPAGSIRAPLYWPIGLFPVRVSPSLFVSLLMSSPQDRLLCIAVKTSDPFPFPLPRPLPTSITLTLPFLAGDIETTKLGLSTESATVCPSLTCIRGTVRPVAAARKAQPSRCRCMDVIRTCSCARSCTFHFYC
jgi:hypothetical protein